jgi:hypothetical protein
MQKQQLTQVQRNAVTRMQQRIAVVQQLRASKNAARKHAAAQAAFIAGVQQLAAQHGIANVQHLLHTGTARANSATVTPSNTSVVVDGVALRPCAAVHALCAKYPHYTRAQMVQLCTDNGINKATASTQVGVYRTAAAKAAAQQQ